MSKLSACRVEMRAADTWNAPADYYLVRVVLTPGVYIDAELNPRTNGCWRPALYLGPDDCGESEAVCLGAIERPAAALIGLLDAERERWQALRVLASGAPAVGFAAP